MTYSYDLLDPCPESLAGCSPCWEYTGCDDSLPVCDGTDTPACAALPGDYERMTLPLRTSFDTYDLGTVFGDFAGRYAVCWRHNATGPVVRLGKFDLVSPALQTRSWRA